MPNDQPRKEVRPANDQKIFGRGASRYESQANPEGQITDVHPAPPPFILVIETSLTLCTIIDVHLRRFPHPIRWAIYNVALEALRDIHAGTIPIPNGALIRLNLPGGLNGLGVAHFMREHGYTTHIVMLLEQDRRMDRVLARLAGANAVLVKPFTLDDLDQFFASCFPTV